MRERLGTLRLTAVALHMRGMTCIQLVEERVMKRLKMGEHILSASWKGKSVIKINSKKLCTSSYKPKIACDVQDRNGEKGNSKRGKQI